MLSIFIALLVAGALWLYLLDASGRGIPVLMYHKVSPEHADDLTVTTAQLEAHLQYLQANGYHILPMQRLLTYVTTGEALPAKPVFITFDDGYLNNLHYAYPLLQKYKAPATIFLPTAYIGQTSSWDHKADDLMNLDQLKSLDEALVSFGLHSHLHQSYQALRLDEITTDLQQNMGFFKDNGLSFLPVFAYPYGKRPKNRTMLKQMKALMQNTGVVAAFRIGNRLNRFMKDVYELQRLDIRGTDTPEAFQKKLKGRAKLPF
ncbi:polysaccharide deacetylase family protein [Emticicia fluvialis]|uniref:polysaccharide deacetylase family protein n=1 Tax=Emticicia fluvialis TaxID=2974474 RepID=UPI0021652674|nr:polysaccharide deacetylase family protein [Emticicia fluvialis]